MARRHQEGATFTEIREVAPSAFGFAVAAHPRDPQTATGSLWVSDDAGDSWQTLSSTCPLLTR